MEIVALVETPAQVIGKELANGGLPCPGDAHQDDNQETSLSSNLTLILQRFHGAQLLATS